MLGKISCLLVPFVQIRRKHTVCPPEGAAAFQTRNNPVTASRQCGACEKKELLKSLLPFPSRPFMFPSASSFFSPSPLSKPLPCSSDFLSAAPPSRVSLHFAVEEQMKNPRRPSAFIAAAERSHMGSEGSRLNTLAGRRRR